MPAGECERHARDTGRHPRRCLGRPADTAGQMARGWCRVCCVEVRDCQDPLVPPACRVRCCLAILAEPLHRATEDQVEDISPYDEDSWYDDEWDWEWSEEPAITYRQAIEQLRSLIQTRADVRIDWDEGRRGPRDDARIVFTGATGTAELWVRFRSASQLNDFTRIINSASLLADRHALWYPHEQVITARLLGDYDQLHAAVVRALVPKLNRRTFVPDSPLGRDVAGLLGSTGEFAVKEPATPPSLQSRTIRVVYANQDLRLLYRPHIQNAPSVAIELTGFAAPDAAGAEQTLLEYGTSYLFKLARATGVSLRLWRSEYRLGSRKDQIHSGKMRFPQRHYDADPAELYAAGNSAARDPIERYLKYYQVLEFYMPKAADSIAASQGIPVDRATSPLRPPPQNLLRFEQNKLDCVISLALTSNQTMHFLNNNDLFASLSNSQIIQDVQTLSTDTTGQRIAGYDYRLEISTRIYDIRNRIVHMKEGGNRRSQHLLAPYSREARDLAADLRLVRFLAEQTMEYWSQPFP
jgi:hypothetical protein